MKATIDIPDDLYRQVKAKSALEGYAIREVAISLFQNWVDPAARTTPRDTPLSFKDRSQPPPAWFGALRKYAHHAKGRYDMDSVRRSIARGRAEKEPSA